VAGFGGGMDFDESQAKQIFEKATKELVAKIISKIGAIKRQPRRRRGPLG